MSELERLLCDVKGDFAESLVRHLFRRSGYEAKVFGVWKVSWFQCKVESEIGKGRTDHPDLRITGKNAKPRFVEVKFRANGLFDRRDRDKMARQMSYWSQHGPFCVVAINCHRKPYFRVLRLDTAREKFTRSAANPLVAYQWGPLESAEWLLDPEIYKAAEGMVENNRHWLE